VQLGDLDGDGDLDAFLANGHEISGVGQSNRVYLNDGTGTFTDSGQKMGKSLSTDVQLADLDGDGDLDAWVTNGTRHFGYVVDQPNDVWLNDGSGVFTLGQEMGDAASYTVALADIDNDGDLDAFVGNIGQSNQIWINTQVIPFQGSFEAVETSDIQPPTMFVVGNGSGVATYLGNYTVTFNHTVNLDDFTGVGAAHFIAADGASISTTITATASVPDPVATVIETHTITGGTGRFAGTTGSFVLERIVNTETGVSATGSFDGTISIPIAGDSNRDGIFNSGDLVAVFTAGKYEDGIPGNATFEEGDWNGDGDFDSADLVFVFQKGNYDRTAIAGSLFDHPSNQVIAKRRGIETDKLAQHNDINLIDQAFNTLL
jgi:hypothetical protein